MKRILASLMAVLLMVSLFTTAAVAADTPDPAAHVHVYEDALLDIPATCKTEGKLVYQCTGEGECDLPAGLYTETLPVVPCEGTDEPVGDREPTCYLEGYTGDTLCKWCLTVLEEGEAIPMTEHTLGDWITDELQSTDDVTVRHRFCTVCLALAETEEVPAEPGSHVHEFGDPIISTEPTCKTEGLKLYICTAEGCDLTANMQTETLPVVPCEAADEPVGDREPTCYLEGYTGDTVCKWCLTVLEEGEAIPMTEHTLGDWITDELQSNDDVTVRHRFCTVCLALAETEEIPAEPDTMPDPFADVSSDDYYFDSVLWAVENGITAGTSPNRFSPDRVCTRAEVVTMLWRAAGSPAPVSDGLSFEDVAADAYYYAPVLWAVENGITAGTDTDHFSPDALCTRAQVMTMLWRAESSITPETDTEAFLDVAAEDYFYIPVLWAVENDITGGTGLFLFSPDAPCSRAQIVTFLYKAR